MLCCSSEEVGQVDCTVDLVAEFIKSQLTMDDSSTRRLRGPYLAQLELMRLLRHRHDTRWNTVFGVLLIISKFKFFFVFSLIFVIFQLRSFDKMLGESYVLVLCIIGTIGNIATV